MYNSITYTVEIQIKWKIKGFDSYGFGTDEKLYNLKTSREIKKTYKDGCIGYWISHKFISLSKLRTLLFIPKKECLPF